MPKKRGSQNQYRSALKVSGPESIQTLRGRVFGHEVALICCSESHEDAIDLTRNKSIPEPNYGWTEPAYNTGKGLDLSKAQAVKKYITRQQARKWGKKIMEEEEDSDESTEEDVGAWLVFRVVSTGQEEIGHAYVLPSEIGLSSKFAFGQDTTIYQWADLDNEARSFNHRRLAGHGVPVDEHLSIIADRKRRCRDQGFELFDDWVIRQSQSSKVQVNVVVEAPVPASEVELHRESSAKHAPAAHECLRGIELDSDEDSDDDDDANDGTSSFLAYLYHRLRTSVPSERLHCIDPRELGCDGENDHDAFQALLVEPLPRDEEDVELENAGAQLAVPPIFAQNSPLLKPAVMRRQGGQWRRARTENRAHPLPAWEAFFGVAAEILYHSPIVKADYAPFLIKCVRKPDTLVRFFDQLYFGTVPEALAMLHINEETRQFSRIRSLAYRAKPDAPLMRRPPDQGLVPAKFAPFDIYLKAVGSNPPRTWIAGLVDKLHRCGGGPIVDAARKWYEDSVLKLLNAPKGDNTGDYFVAWLRECHRDVFDDIDTSDPAELQNAQWADSESKPGKKHRHNLQEIRIPAFKAAFAELLEANLEAATTTKRQRVLAKMLVDAFQLRLVDLAAIFRVAMIAAEAPKGDPVVVVIYAGADHTKSIAEFWRSRGFSPSGLPNDGLVGKDEWEDDEARCMELPSYLRKLDELFPIGEHVKDEAFENCTNNGLEMGVRKRASEEDDRDLEICKRRRKGQLLSPGQWRRFFMRRCQGYED